jgi:hypothetical protein
LGLVQIWDGAHAYFGSAAALFATRRGGLLLLEHRSATHPAIERYRGKAERYFHVAVTARDLAHVRAEWEGSPQVAEVSRPYRGPVGQSIVARLRVGESDALWIECVEGGEVEAPASAFARVESTAMVAASRQLLVDPLRALGLHPDARVSDGRFPSLGAINSVVLLDWHYLEVNEPTGDGFMAGFLRRLEGPGIFGINLEPVDMRAFVARTVQEGVTTNTPETVRLQVEVRGQLHDCADIITVSPRATGGARLFVLTPREYPWKLVN